MLPGMRDELALAHPRYHPTGWVLHVRVRSLVPRDEPTEMVAWHPSPRGECEHRKGIQGVAGGDGASAAATGERGRVMFYFVWIAHNFVDWGVVRAETLAECNYLALLYHADGILNVTTSTCYFIP